MPWRLQEAVAAIIPGCQREDSAHLTRAEGAQRLRAQDPKEIRRLKHELFRGLYPGGSGCTAYRFKKHSGFLWRARGRWRRLTIAVSPWRFSMKVWPMLPGPVRADPAALR